MNKEYDFSGGVRGKYAAAEASFHLPVYLEDDIQAVLQTQADNQHMELTVLVNRLLRNSLPTVRP